ncbi:MAG: MarR family transcriptional regulator [Candidatus Fournierella pullistercoris]|uniref:MarR family transcriptional regulator n=1 Tax=Candidatus Allofournierella pullistercoris TaxID=2838597 RepID=A0A948T3H3_9FIRM|nr:MarR family transcriptional regulator [Candidatus Fournierella pullistercoris]
MENTNYDALKLENQLCFLLYVSSREIVKRYKPLLDKIDLTYTQYIAMLVLWEKKQLTVKELGEYLDSGTLTPLLKKLEYKGFVTRVRSEKDERSLVVTLTQEGEKLKEQAVEIPLQIAGCINLTPQEGKLLYDMLHKVLG